MRDDPIMPILVIADTGGAADWLKWAKQNIKQINKEERDQLKSKFQEEFPNTVLSVKELSDLISNLRWIVISFSQWVSKDSFLYLKRWKIASLKKDLLSQSKWITVM